MEELIKNEINSLEMFGASSANNDDNKHLWIKSASLFINQTISLIKKIDPKYNIRIYDISSFNNENADKLGNILKRNRSDKSTLHNYHYFYSYIFSRQDEDISNILEIGLGTNNPDIVSTMGINGRPGASLYSWKEFLSNTNIYGADIDKDILFNEDRIKTCFVDQLEIETFNNIKEEFGDIKYDIIIDDGLHSIGANFNTLLFALDNIKKNGWIIIEDVSVKKINTWFAVNYILIRNKNIETFFVKARHAFMICIHNLGI